MKIDDSFRTGAFSGMQSFRQRTEQRQTGFPAPADSQSLSALAKVAAANAAASETSVRPLKELQAMVARATSADPFEIADALLSRGFLFSGE